MLTIHTYCGIKECFLWENCTALEYKSTVSKAVLGIHRVVSRPGPIDPLLCCHFISFYGIVYILQSLCVVLGITVGLGSSFSLYTILFHNQEDVNTERYLVRLKKVLDEIFRKPPFSALAPSWLWSNRAWKVSLGGVPRHRCLRYLAVVIPENAAAPVTTITLRTMLALCQRTLGKERHRYAIA